MRLPGFTAEASVYHSAERYWQTAYDLTTGPGAITPSSLPPDPCRRCNALVGCARARCFCQCEGGDILPNSHARCGFYCI